MRTTERPKRHLLLPRLVKICQSGVRVREDIRLPPFISHVYKTECKPIIVHAYFKFPFRLLLYERVGKQK